MGYSTVAFNGVVLNITNLKASRKQKTVKQVIGRKVSEIDIIGMNAQQWELQLTGLVFGTTSANLDTNRTEIEALDDADSHTYVDGIHDGVYIMVPESLSFDDVGSENINYYRYSCRLVEY